MPRCNACSMCLEVLDYRKAHKQKRDVKKVKRFETSHPCGDGNVPSKKMRMTEAQSLNTTGYEVHGGRLRGVKADVTIPNSPVVLKERSARPKNSLSEDISFNQESFDQYTDIVLQCTQIYESTASSAVKAEGPSIISKMRGFISPSVKCEVDYEEALKDVCNVFVRWQKGEAAGKRAFIPDINDRNECYNALKIFSHAAEEAKLIPGEFCKEFGKVGIHIYNDLINIIGERDKNCLPFVNMCLRTWMEHLSDKPDIWADLYLFDFDEWLVDKLENPRSKQHGAKTSYELMMAVFGNEKEPTYILKNSQTSDITPKTATTTSPSPITSVAKSRPKLNRQSKLQKIGKTVRDRLIKSHYYRVKQNSSNKATAEIQALIANTTEGVLNEHVMRSCREASHKMEDLLFSVGGAERIVATLRYFRRHQTVQELDKAAEIMDGDTTSNKKSKEGRLHLLVMDGLRNFLGMFHSRRGGKGGGRRSLEDQNVFDAIMAAINTKEFATAKLGRMLSRSLNVSRRQIKRGRAIRKEMEDLDTKNWVRCSSTVPKSAIQEEHKAAISEWMHSSECSRVDNNNKIPSIVDLGVCPTTGARMYDLHDRRELFYDDNEIIDALTGRNRVDKNKSNAPHPVWEEITRATKSAARPNGIKGSTKLIRQCKCSCMKKMRASVCSCIICERFKDALRRFNKYQVGWRHQADLKRKQDLIQSLLVQEMSQSDIKKYLDGHPNEILCQLCNNDCHPGSKYHTFSVSPSACANALLCDKVHVPELDLPKLDINFRAIPGETDEFYMHPEKCCYGYHVGINTSASSASEIYQKCGWDATFKSMPRHERIEINDTTGEEVKHCIRACPDDYKRGGKVTWMDFQKVARSGVNASGDADDGDYDSNDGVKFQTEWLPVEGSPPQFLEHLNRSIDAYLPHAYGIKLSNRAGKMAERAFLIDPIADDNCPKQFKDTVLECVDFTTDIHAKRDHDITCSFPETHKCEVHHITFSPKFVTVNEIEKNHQRSAKTLRKRNVDRVIRPENVVIYCFSKFKSSAASNQQATTNIISIVKYGKMPDGSKCEAFLDQKRIPGGDTTGHPDLPEGKLSEWGSMEPLYADVKRWRRSRDGCAAQYQGKGAFRGMQTMTARHGIICEDRRKVSMHGKDIADGDGSAVSGMVKKSFYDNYGKGTQNLVRHLAHKYPQPKRERHTRYFGERGMYASTQYIFMYLPEDGIDETIVSVEEGYSGSSKDHYYRSIGATDEASRLLCRERACGCRPCLQLLARGCTLTPANTTLAAGTTPTARNIKLYSAKPAPVACHTRNARNPISEFCINLKVGENVIVRVSNEEREENLDEDYFIAKIEKRAVKLDESGVYSAVPFRKNDWIVYARWYNFVPSKQNEHGDRFYSKGYVQWIPCNSIIRCLTMPVSLKWSRRYYQVSKSLHTHIEKYGDILY